MARQRAALTDKEEKILVQAQLMGLSTESMVKIGNRLKALEQEREKRQQIDSITSQYSHSAIPTGWLIKGRDGHEFRFTNRKVTVDNSRWTNRSKTVYYDVSVDKPGTRFIGKSKKSQKIWIDPSYPARLCPDGSKELLGLMRHVARGSVDGIT